MGLKELIAGALLFVNLAGAFPLFTKFNGKFEKSFVLRDESLEEILDVDRDMNISFNARILEHKNFIIDGYFMERTTLIKNEKHIWNTPYTQEFCFGFGGGISLDKFETTLDYSHYCLHYFDSFPGEISSTNCWQLNFNSKDYGFKKKNEWRAYLGKYLSQKNFAYDYIIHGDCKLYSKNLYVSPSLDLCLGDEQQLNQGLELGYDTGWFTLFFRNHWAEDYKPDKTQIGFQARLE